VSPRTSASSTLDSPQNTVPGLPGRSEYECPPARPPWFFPADSTGPNDDTRCPRPGGRSCSIRWPDPLLRRSHASTGHRFCPHRPTPEALAPPTTSLVRSRCLPSRFDYHDRRRAAGAACEQWVEHVVLPEPRNRRRRSPGIGLRTSIPYPRLGGSRLATPAAKRPPSPRIGASFERLSPPVRTARMEAVCSGRET